MNVLCPIHNKPDCIKKKQIFLTKKIIEQYNYYYNTDVTSYFKNLNSIDLLVCFKTNYQFFHPQEIAGDYDFYKKISEKNNYYLHWKWEYEKASRWISDNESVLELGCGNGNFLINISKKASYCVGIDLMATTATYDNVKILKEDYQTFFAHNSLKFDVIVAFQFLEHVYDVKEFFRFVKNSLNPEGKLILAVPDNNSLLIKREESLNFPPHHMGWWTKKSLRKAGQHFGFHTIYLKSEPLQPYLFNRRSYMKEVIRIEKLGIFGKLLNKLFYPGSLFLYKKFSYLFKGHSFIIVLVKK